MFEALIPKNYDLVYKDLLKRLDGIDLDRVAKDKGVKVLEDGVLEVPLLNRNYQVRKEGVFIDGKEEEDFKKKILILYYVTGDGFLPISGEWVSYREFRNAMNFYGYFKRYVEGAVASSFRGRVGELERAARALGGTPYEFGTGDLSISFKFFPKVPMLLIFWDGDEELDASSVILFDKNAIDYLDEECLAVCGWVLAEELIKLGGRGYGG